MTLPAEFAQIRLELAREQGHPEGDRGTGYEIIAPLDSEGRLMPDIWKLHRDRCRVRHFREGEDDRLGNLRRHPGGSWYFDYDRERRDDDETGYRLSEEKFVVGEYVSIPDEHRRMHTYRVVSVRPA
jgi:nuclear transport factor 2 (NTF2) superfamily protein